MYSSTPIFLPKKEGDMFLVLECFETLSIQGVSAHPNMAEKILMYRSIDIYDIYIYHLGYQARDWISDINLKAIVHPSEEFKLRGLLQPNLVFMDSLVCQARFLRACVLLIFSCSLMRTFLNTSSNGSSP